MCSWRSVSAWTVGGGGGGVTLQCVGKSGGTVRTYSKCRFQDASENAKYACILFFFF